MLDYYHALATVEDIMVENMKKLDLEMFKVLCTGVAVWDSNVWFTVLLTGVRCLVSIHLTELQLSLLLEVLVLPFGLPRLY